jgi:hypothetical protein
VCCHHGRSSTFIGTHGQAFTDERSVHADPKPRFHCQLESGGMQNPLERVGARDRRPALDSRNRGLRHAGPIG